MHRVASNQLYINALKLVCRSRILQIIFTKSKKHMWANKKNLQNSASIVGMFPFRAILFHSLVHKSHDFDEVIDIRLQERELY